MFVLSVEGQGFINRETWATHKILGVFDTRDEALESEALEGLGEEDVVLLTDTDGKTVQRVTTG